MLWYVTGMFIIIIIIIVVVVVIIFIIIRVVKYHAVIHASDSK